MFKLLKTIVLCGLILGLVAGMSQAKVIEDWDTDKQGGDITDVGTMDIDTVDIDGGVIDDTAIGGTTPSTGAFTTLSATGQITSTLADGTAPLTVTSTTLCPNLNADRLDSKDESEFADLSDNETVTGNYIFEGNFTISNNTVVLTGDDWQNSEVADDLTMSGGIVDNSIIGGTTPASATFTTCTIATLTSTKIIPTYLRKTFCVQKLKIPAGSPPGDDIIGTFPVLDFSHSSDEQVYATWHIDNRYIDGTDLGVGFHWAPTTTATGDVTWGVQWEARESNNDDVLGAGSTTQIRVDAAEGVANELFCTGCVNLTISGTGLTAGEFIGFRFFRDANASENGASDDYGADAALIGVDIRYQIENFGEPL